MTKEELVKELKRVDISGKTYAEYVDAIADKVIEIFNKEKKDARQEQRD